MLKEYKFGNYLSFRDEQNFSMEAGKYMERFKDNYIEAGKKNRLLKSAVIVGENGGGKTNFFKSINYLKDLLKSNDEIKAYRKSLNVVPESSKQFFELNIVLEDGTEYWYRIGMDHDSITEESLDIRFHDKNKRESVYSYKRKTSKEGMQAGSLEVNNKVLNRQWSEEILGGLYNSAHGGTVLKKMAILEPQVIKPVLDWLENKLIIRMHARETNSEYEQLKEEDEILGILNSRFYLDIFRLVDSSIVAVDIDQDRPFQDSVIVRRRRDGSLYEIEIGSESSGIIEFFSWAIDIYRVIYEDKILVADGLDRVLNPILADKVIAYIHGSKHKGQFVFSTHNVLHLNTVNFTKEQMWFVSKEKEQLTSELYSLADFPDFRYDKTDIYDLYLRGILGGTPYE